MEANYDPRIMAKGKLTEIKCECFSLSNLIPTNLSDWPLVLYSDLLS
jgi:hypothetical protein